MTAWFDDLPYTQIPDMKLFKLITITLVLSSGAAMAQDISYDMEMGGKYAAQVDSTMGIYDDVEKTAYVNAVGQRLVAQLEEPLFKYQFKIVPTSVPNAFALPGGYLYITTGLIPLLENEDELACIMAHEIIHSNNRHSVKSMRKGILPAILQIPGNIVGVFSQTAGAVLNAPIKAISGLGMLSYSRKQETEADVEGVQLAARAGYNPEALKGILTRLSTSMEIASGEAETKSYLSDHPYTPDRVSEIDKILTDVKIKTTKQESDNFLMEFDGILAGDDPSNGLIKDQHFYQPTFNFSLSTPKGWELAQQGNMVATGDEKQNAALYCSYSESDTTAEAAGKAFLEKLDPNSKKSVMGSEEIEINGVPGFIVSYSQSAKGKEVYGFRIWMNMNETMYQFYGVGYLEYREKLEEIVYSVKPLTVADKKEITISALSIVKANDGETIQTLGKRTNNTLKDKMAAVINNHDISQPFKTGEEVKIVVANPYFGK